jgi:hypothetical protein
MISDAASAAILDAEVWRLYRHGSRDLEQALSAPRVQYADYAVWLDKTLPEWCDRHAPYWRERLSNAPTTRLPGTLHTESSSVRASSVKHFPFGKAVSLGLRTLAEHCGARVQWIVFAIYACAMSRWCRQQDLLVALASHGRRTHPELKTMIGFLANVLYVRTRIDESASFLELIAATQREILTAFAHYDFDRAPQIVPDLNTELCFNWVTTGTPGKAQQSGDDAGLRLQSFNVRMAWAGKLWTFFSDTPAGIIASIAYSPDAFSAQLIEQMGNDLRSLASAFAQDPSASMSSLR